MLGFASVICQCRHFIGQPGQPGQPGQSPLRVPGRHAFTVGCDTPTSRAISTVGVPSAANKNIGFPDAAHVVARASVRSIPVSIWRGNLNWSGTSLRS